jgi:flagellar protein FliO/FliZ
MFVLKRFIALLVVLATTGSPFVLVAAAGNENPVNESTESHNTATLTETDGAPESAVATANSDAPVKEPVISKAKPVQPPAAQPPVKVNGVSSLLSVFVGLLFILGLILALAWFVKRIGQGGMTANNHLRILASLPLGTRERLALVDVGGKQILLGLTPQNINTLHVFDEPVIDSASAEPSEFALKLRSLLNPAAKNNQTTEHHR